MSYKVGDNVRFVPREIHGFPLTENLPKNESDPGDLVVVDPNYQFNNLVTVYSQSWYDRRIGHGGGRGMHWGHRFLKPYELELSVSPTLKSIEDMEDYQDLFE